MKSQGILFLAIHLHVALKKSFFFEANVMLFQNVVTKQLISFKLHSWLCFERFCHGGSMKVRELYVVTWDHLLCRLLSPVL